MKELHPVNQNVLVDINENSQEQKTAGGIIIPDTVKEKPEFGKVVALSNITDSEIAVGETVLFKKYSGTETEFEGHNYLLIPYTDILAKIVETDEI
jgi:chaperonin GroES